MKTLKITLLLLAVLLLTVSGQTSDSIVDSTDTIEFKQHNKTDLLAHTKKGLKLPNNG
ncbi:hypothetical protein [Psychroserpens sp. SPM9]|uniref:hypothetical protein n=1 Tax=Psychroserpens sp. SPM9 TaxID=2975598 RepID=UPI0021A6B600|nr:hypothetical protein [Psychroserpens sp. SPM9]MDG5490346.1 hypothetical protein [Psychroserpens sp. SPM9]